MSSRSEWPAYNPQVIESKWQQHWEASGLYLAHQTAGQPKFYCLEFFPYPSGDGLHVGHCRNYVPTDVLSRFWRMNGFNVLHPMGWDAFGEPTEQHAIAHGIQPRESIKRNTANFKRQLQMIGTGYDWSREIDSSDPAYYRWTQWFFLLLYRRGLAYRDTNWQWWCPTCQTTLSSHEAVGGVCWRGHEGVTKKEIPAWYFRITAYAERLLEGLDRIDWPESIKAMQRNWIGRSEGILITFPLPNDPTQGIQVFTTRPDTLYGVTFFLLAPEHPLAVHITTPERAAEVQEYLVESARQSEVDRMKENRPKTGVFTGGYVVHPLSGALVPVWIADYVLMGYGTGAVMGVPAHDPRDFEFAQTHHLPLQVVIQPPGGLPEPLHQAYPGSGVLVNSGRFSGFTTEEAIPQINCILEQLGLGKPTVQYRMRDWLISRQRYWGAPIPIVHCPTCGEVPVPEEQLPVLLPPMQNFQPDGSGCSPLARLEDFVHTPCPRCGGPAQRETDTMGGFACSSWYFLRFASPHYDQGPFDPQAMDAWLPVDLYVGGAEHAVLHLLYARFWVKVMHDAGLLPFDEPFPRLLNQGQLMGPDGKRMSKSRGNVVTPDSVVASHGADSLRLYEMFMAPFDQDVNWSTDGLNGALRFLQRVWTLFAETYPPSASLKARDPALQRLTQRTIRQVTERMETMRFNTMVSTLMEFVNALAERQRQSLWKTTDYHQALDTLIYLLAPGAPHIAEELWQRTGHPGSIHQQPWPTYDPKLVVEETLSIAIQVDGKTRDVISLEAEATEAEVEAAALASPSVQRHLAGRQIQKRIYIPGKIFSLVTLKEK